MVMEIASPALLFATKSKNDNARHLSMTGIASIQPACDGVLHGMQQAALPYNKNH